VRERWREGKRPRRGEENKEIESEKKRNRKGGRGRETERREHARTRAEDNAARTHDNNKWVDERVNQ